MSKQRPSGTTFWRKRVFKNTFTRDGKLKRVRGWSVKIQHEGLRRTISLRGRSREAAALEAQKLYGVLRNEGWDAALAAHVGVQHSQRPPGSTPKHEPHPARDDAWPKTDARYWRPRLMRRNRPGLARNNDKANACWSARIEHEGTSHYFPTDTADEKAAATQAADIYRTILGGGWEAACRRFSRELTLAFQWAANPVAWTYITLHTEVENGKCRSSRFSVSEKNSLNHECQRGGARIALVESDLGLQWTLLQYLSPYALVQPYDNADEALREIPRQRVDFVLVNQVLPKMAGAQFLGELERLSPRVPVITFSTYEDSNQLFLCTPGGAEAYLLKRTPPEHLLAPIEGLLLGRELSRENISQHVRDYFYGASLSLQPGEPHPWMNLLTPREKQILDCLSKGYVDKEIAEELGISAWTVHGHVKNIFEKLDVHSRTSAVVKYLHK